MRQHVFIFRILSFSSHAVCGPAEISGIAVVTWRSRVSAHLILPCCHWVCPSPFPACILVTVVSEVLCLGFCLFLFWGAFVLCLFVGIFRGVYFLEKQNQNPIPFCSHLSVLCYTMQNQLHGSCQWLHFYCYINRSNVLAHFK